MNDALTSERVSAALLDAEDSFRYLRTVQADRAPVYETIVAALNEYQALDKIRTDAEQMISEGCTNPSPEAFAYLAHLRERHVEQIRGLEQRLGLR